MSKERDHRYWAKSPRANGCSAQNTTCAASRNTSAPTSTCWPSSPRAAGLRMLAVADGARGFNFPLPQRSMLRPGEIVVDLFAGGGHARAAGFRVPRTHELARA